ncbi:MULTISPECIES: NAD(P)-dependent oxidoreductase [Amycolatopsis]|uniref:NAD(P)-binding domain-containing protein n=1 Tax=Amycolatopsis thermalba TaxID=944492 RepID=A0ABY4NU18_9PSEU|nr:MULTISPECIES: NAD(P)-binding domain-containing protein [Amycolatopsis]OXM72979.1 6-phosphogluconate dehydrogenase [Amycolatopsis sp. KNN50.9b]UQS23531.1 NAD(P)-binding domain-containing protein [Amycolatopsis thermalba]
MTNEQSASARQAPVTVVGLGPMGLALAGALRGRGHRTTVWNRTPGKADRLVATGVRRAATVAEAVSASPVTIMCLKDYETMYEVFGSAGDALRGRVLVNLNSGTPKEAHAAAGWAAERGVSYLDGAIMVPPPMVGHPGSVFLYSGSREVFDEHRPTLASMGDPRYLGSDPGLAVLYNTALLEMMYATINGYLHATAMAGSAGVPAVEFAELAIGWFLPAVLGPMLAEEAPVLDKGEYPGDLGTLEMNLNALDHIARTAQEQGVQTDQPRLMREIAARAIADGHGGKNYLAVFEVFKHQAR